jgi:hypothetical protein
MQNFILIFADKLNSRIPGKIEISHFPISNSNNQFLNLNFQQKLTKLSEISIFLNFLGIFLKWQVQCAKKS